jgi:hypothetical protein
MSEHQMAMEYLALQYTLTAAYVALLLAIIGDGLWSLWRLRT